MIVPAPQSLVPGTGHFALDRTTRITAGPGTEEIARLLRDALAPATGLPFDLADHGSEQHDIELIIDGALAPAAYRLSVTADGIRITGGDAAGVFHGTQSLRQLLPPASLRRAAATATLPAGVPWSVPLVEIEDAPEHRWRGLMLDVVRHFMPVREVLRIIDLLALHRMNTLHLHLTDDQGWRIQILKYPKLTEVGAWRSGSQIGHAPDAGEDTRPHGGFYTQDDIREIVAYAAARHITVVPEIETPGHARAALAAYPQLGVTGEQLEVWRRWGISDDVFNVEESTIDFLTDVFDEVMALFPSRFIGVGGDECPKTQWKNDPRTQERMRELGLENEEQLQSWVIGRLDAHITAAGRRSFGWDEILEGGLAPGATVSSWRGLTGAIVAARRGHDVISCPDDQVYLDYRQSDRDDEPIPISIVLTWRDVYAFEPVPAELTADEARHVLGGQANLWTEHIDTPARVDYMLFPRVCALSETLWTGPSRRIEDFEDRLPLHLERLDALGVAYRPEAGPHPWQQIPGVPGRPSTREQRAAYIAEMTANIAD
ncbi:MAG: beta-N-acetylhexosaminidase [Microbacteriaceae bacterium]